MTIEIISQPQAQPSSVLYRSMKPEDKPLKVISGKGVEFFLEDGTVILDACGGAAVTSLGNGHPVVVEAVKAQVERCAYAYNLNFSTEPAEELAKMLCDSSDGAFDRVGFLSGGSEAMEAALKLGRQYFYEIGQSQRVKFISRRLSYHGNTLGSLAVSGHVGRRQGYEPMLADNFEQVGPAFEFRFKPEEMGEKMYLKTLCDELEATFRRIGPDRVIGFVAETVVGTTCGCVVPPKGYFPAIKSICDKYGALLILDEVMCGMGRMGSMHAWQIYGEGVQPDIQAIAKGLGGGYQPIGAIFMSGKVSSALERGSSRWMHGHTYSAHPVSCAAALAVQKVIRDEKLLVKVLHKGEIFFNRLRSEIDSNALVKNHIGDVRGGGLFWAIEFIEDGRKCEKTPFPTSLSPRFSERVARVGLEDYKLVMMGMCGVADLEGKSGDCAIFAPSFLVTEDELDEIVIRFVLSVEKVLKAM